MTSVAGPSVSLPKAAPPAEAALVARTVAIAPAIINSVRQAGGYSGQATSSSDVQSQVNGLNALMELFGHMDWAKLAQQVGIAAAGAGQQQYLTNLQLAEGSTMASPGGVTGVHFNFEKPDASVLLSVPSANVGTSAITQTLGFSTTTVAGLNVRPSTPPAGASVALALLSAQSPTNSDLCAPEAPYLRLGGSPGYSAGKPSLSVGCLDTLGLGIRCVSCYRFDMAQRMAVEGDTDPAQQIHMDLPNHAASQAEFLALVDEGLADIAAGRTVEFDTVANNLRRRMYGRT